MTLEPRLRVNIPTWENVTCIYVFIYLFWELATFPVTVIQVLTCPEDK